MAEKLQTKYELGDWVHFFNTNKTAKHLGQIVRIHKDQSGQIAAYDIRCHSLNAMEVPSYLIIGRYVENYG